jgi:hypothetical protein
LTQILGQPCEFQVAAARPERRLRRKRKKRKKRRRRRRRRRRVRKRSHPYRRCGVSTAPWAWCPPGRARRALQNLAGDTFSRCRGQVADKLTTCIPWSHPLAVHSS